MYRLRSARPKSRTDSIRRKSIAKSADIGKVCRSCRKDPGRGEGRRVESQKGEGGGPRVESQRGEGGGVRAEGRGSRARGAKAIQRTEGVAAIAPGNRPAGKCTIRGKTVASRAAPGHGWPEVFTNPRLNNYRTDSSDSGPRPSALDSRLSALDPPPHSTAQSSIRIGMPSPSSVGLWTAAILTLTGSESLLPVAGRMA